MDSVRNALQKVLANIHNSKVKTAQERAVANFNKNWQTIGHIRPSVKIKGVDSEGNPTVTAHPLGHYFIDKDGNKNDILVPVRQFVGHDGKNKYTGAKLRDIRKKQAEAAVKGQTHFSDGTPIVTAKIVEMW